MQSQSRRYRSHLQPACFPCRRRKSRCQTENTSSDCLMCRAHQTECLYPENPTPNTQRPRSHMARRSRRSCSASRASAELPSWRSQPTTTSSRAELPARNPQHYSTHDGNVNSSFALEPEDSHDHNLHIVGPAVVTDSQVLTDYLARFPELAPSTRMIIPESAGRSKPVLFKTVQKRPLGMATNPSVAAEKLHIIEQLLQPSTTDVVDEYFRNINICMPTLDEQSFQKQYRDDRSKISPALLACLYAHMSVYRSRSASKTSSQPFPDSRFIWNLATGALYSELQLAPGMSIIKAILLNVGGRPTTSLIGNGVLLGSAVSMAYSLGLNHNPMPWNITPSEKFLRMKIWWVLLIHDRWISLAHGTPPHISKSQYNVPPPKMENLCESNATDVRNQASHIFIALVGLTDALGECLQYIYQINKDTRVDGDVESLQLRLNNWIESLSGSTRSVVLRGSRLDIPGAASLRLAYLTVRLLIQRMEHEATKHQAASQLSQIENRYLQAKHTAEEILVFTQELQGAQLRGFWQSVSSFSYPATVNFLLRCALEAETSPYGLAQNASFKIARDFITTLRRYQKEHDWDIGDVCLAQHTEIVDKILAGAEATGAETEATDTTDSQAFVIPDASIIDQLFPNLWDSLQNPW